MNGTPIRIPRISWRVFFGPSSKSMLPSTIRMLLKEYFKGLLFLTGFFVNSSIRSVKLYDPSWRRTMFTYGLERRISLSTGPPRITDAS